MGISAIPTGNDERVTWALNFESNFPLLGETLGFAATEITAAVNDCAMMRYVILNAQAAAAFSKSCTAYKNQMLGGIERGAGQPETPEYNALTAPLKVDAGILERLSVIIQRAKLSPKFNQAVAEQLMIAAPPTTRGDAADAKPTANGAAMSGSVVRIEWTKREFDGVLIDAQRGDETVWTRLDFDMRSPYEDKRSPLVAGKPEERRYRLIYFTDNQPVGLWSDALTVITQP